MPPTAASLSFIFFSIINSGIINSHLQKWIVDFQNYALLTVGSLSIAAGGTISGLYAIKGSYLGVFIGYLCFLIGYKICWVGEHKACHILNFLKNYYQNLTPSEGFKQNFSQHSMTLSGIFLIAIGTTILAQIIIGESNMNPGISGAITFGGYMIAHKGVNGVLV